MKATFLTLFLAVSLSALADRTTKRPDSYNYTRGVEAVQNENTEEAISFLKKELDDNSKNGYAHAWLGAIYIQQEEYGEALNAINQGIKYLPKKDNEYLGFCYGLRSKVFLCMEDSVQGLADICQAIRLCPDDQNYYEFRAQLYFDHEKYDLADADYRKIIELDEGGVMGYMGLGRDLKMQERWDEAIEKFSYVTKLHPDYSSAYSFRAECYIGKKDWNKAADDIVTALGIDGDQKAFIQMQTDIKEFQRILLAKMKIQMAKNPNENYWPYSIGVIHEYAGHYANAIEYYKKSEELNAASSNLERIAECYSKMGAYKSALSYNEMAQRLDSTEYDLIRERADYLYYDHQTDAAIKEITRFIECYPDFYYGYYRRGFYEDNAGLTQAAIDDYTLAIIQSPDYHYAYLGRGDMYMKQGERDLAMEDYRMATQLDTVPSSNSCAQYAYFLLGEKDKAIAFNDSILASYPEDSGVFYDAACLYARMGDTAKSLGYLRMAFEKGYRKFAHIELDDDLEAVRETQSFKELEREYKAKFAEENGTNEKHASEEREETTDIPFTKDGGNLCNVKCDINGLPLYFIFDTGASDVSISQIEASFMMKNGYLTEKDVVGNTYYGDASGNINVGTVINLRKVNFGGLELTNVRASVVQNQKAPLLLGQSILGRLGRIEIDNTNHVIKITRKVQ